MQTYPHQAQKIRLLGLGPGDPLLMTRQAWLILAEANEVYLRTLQHPVVASLPGHLSVHSFDHLYDGSQTFEEVYQQIISEILALGRRPEGVIYAVPGHPFVAEATCPEIARRSRQEGIAVQVIEGLSFIEPVFTALDLDPFPQTVLIDALDLARLHVPSFPSSLPALVAQVHSRLVASDVKLTLMSQYPDNHPVFLVHGAGTAGQKVEELVLYQVDRSEEIGLLTCLYIPPRAEETAFEAFQEVIAHLRAPDGCPWDRAQTHQSLRPYLLEETYETLAALDAEDQKALCEELGDLLLQILLHAQIASEEGEFNMADILEAIHTKIVRRHPHVFGEVKIQDSAGVIKSWEKLKAEERAENGKGTASLLEGVALALPALSQASEYLMRAARHGFDWPDIQGVLGKLEEELDEVHRANDNDQRSLEIGDVLFAIANLARWYDIDPESALREANQRFRHRFAFIEAAARERNQAVSDLSLEEMLVLWDQAKLADN